MDEREKIQQLRKIKVILTEIFMFISVIFLVIFLTLIVTGYSFNLKQFGKTDGEFIERTGLVQISSKPVGATVSIDGEQQLLLRTNGSKTLSSGDHEIILSKDGYGQWEKTVSIKEGMMHRVNYPRLFLNELEEEKVASFPKATFMTTSSNMEKMIVLQDGGLFLFHLNNAKQAVESIKVEKFGKIESLSEVKWSGNSERMLAKINGKYGVINIKNPAESFYLEEVTKEEVGDIEFQSDGGGELVALFKTGEVREIDIKNKKLGEIVAEGVVRFDNDGEKLVFLEKDKNTESYEIKTYRIGDEESYSLRARKTNSEEKIENGSVVEGENDEESREDKTGEIDDVEGLEVSDISELSSLFKIPANQNTIISTMEYFQESFVLVADGEDVKVLSSEEWGDEEVGMEIVYEGKVGFEVQKVEKKGKGMVFGLVGKNGEGAVFDIENLEVTKREKDIEEGSETGWIDEFLRYEIDKTGKVTIFDYDWMNERELVEEGASNKFDIVISGNGKWLYYFKENDLYRERIRY